MADISPSIPLTIYINYFARLIGHYLFNIMHLDLQQIYQIYNNYILIYRANVIECLNIGKYFISLFVISIVDV